MHALLAMCLLCLPLRAQNTAEEPIGYVVRLVDSGTVVLDFSRKSGAVAGQPFEIFKEGEELKHPVSGQILGRMPIKVAEGTLREILPLYSIGTLAAPGDSQSVLVGMRARLKPAPVPAEAAPAATPPVESAAGAKAPRQRGPSLDYQATALAVADCNADNAPEAILSDGHSVYLYPYPLRDDKSLAVFSPKGTGIRILSLEPEDLNGNGRPEIFASLFNESLSRFETVVIELDAQGQWNRLADLPFLVRGYQDPSGKRHLASQQITDDRSFPFGGIYPLAFKDGKYQQGRPAVDFVKRRVDWLYDFTFGSFDGKPATISVGNTELVRVQFDKGSVKTPDAFCQTPNRVRWAGDRLLNFRPRMLVRQDSGRTSLYLVKNIAAMGGLAAPFGLFSRGELTRMDWNGLSLSPAWQGELGGYCAGLALVDVSGGAQELAAAVVGTAGKTSVWSFNP
jgi:hypothetical protein